MKAPRTKLKRHPLEVYYTYDDEADAAYIYLSGPIPRGGVARTMEVKGHRNVYLDFDKGGRLLGVEIIDGRALPGSIAADIKPLLASNKSTEA